MQRLLRPLDVMNPYIESLSYPTDRLISRREQEKYITLIHAIVLLHQYQRPVRKRAIENTDKEYVEVAKEDIAKANQLARAILWRSFDEMAPPVRAMHTQLITLFKQRAKERSLALSKVEIVRREIEKATGWSSWQVRVYCSKLVEMEYLLVLGGYGRPTVYKLACPLDDEEIPALSGLIEV